MKKTSEILNIDLDEILNIEHEKLKSNFEAYCSKCFNNKKNIINISNKNKSNNNINDNDDMKFYDLKLNTITIDLRYKFYESHLICHDCLSQYDKEILGIDDKIVKSIKEIKKDVSISFFCKICHMDHNTILTPKSIKAAWRKNGACANGCVLF